MRDRTGVQLRIAAPMPMSAALITEVVITMMFLLIIMGATDKRAPAGFASIAIGLGLTLNSFDQYSGNEHVS